MSTSLTNPRLWPLPSLDGQRGTALGIVILLTLAASRVLLLPDGPWEQDEAIFATAVRDFDLLRHQPQPPGFPGWIVLGKLLTPLTGDALLSLRLWSCAASVVLFVLLAGLLRRVVSERTALLGALLFCFLPTVWFHAPRAFSTTPALAFCAAALWAWSTAGRGRIVVGWLLLAVAATVRPQLAPVLVVIGGLGLWTQRRRRREMVAGMSAAVALVTASIVLVVLDSGSLDELLLISGEHFGANRVDTVWPGVKELGIVRGLGGIPFAAVWLLAWTAGMLSIIRRSKILGSWLLALALVSGWSILTLHPPIFPRYAILLVLVMLPGILAAVDEWVPKFLNAPLVTGLCLTSLVATIPALWAAHNTPLPMVAALRSFEIEEDYRPLVYSNDLGPWVRHESLEARLTRPTLSTLEMQEAGEQPDGRFVVYAAAEHWLPGVTVTHDRFEDFPAVAWSLSQQRFDRANTLQNAVVPVWGMRPEIELNWRGEPFRWMFNAAEFEVQPGSEILLLAVSFEDGLGPQWVEARSGRRKLLQTELEVGSHLVRIPLEDCETGCRVGIESRDSRPPQEEPRLAARVYGAWSEGPGFERRQAFKASPGLPFDALGKGVQFSGFFEAESFDDSGPGAWTNGRGLLSFAGGPGTLRITLAQPPPRHRLVSLRTATHSYDVEAGASPTTHQIRSESLGGCVELEIAGATHNPNSLGTNAMDNRELGPILFHVVFVPDPPAVPRVAGHPPRGASKKPS